MCIHPTQSLNCVIIFLNNFISTGKPKENLTKLTQFYNGEILQIYQTVQSHFHYYYIGAKLFHGY